MDRSEALKQLRETPWEAPFSATQPALISGWLVDLLLGFLLRRRFPRFFSKKPAKPDAFPARRHFPFLLPYLPLHQATPPAQSAKPASPSFSLCGRPRQLRNFCAAETTPKTPVAERGLLSSVWSNGLGEHRRF
jgi:hypothetical protein